VKDVLEQGREARKRSSEDADVDLDLRPDGNPSPAPELMLVTANEAGKIQYLPTEVVFLPATSRFDRPARHNYFAKSHSAGYDGYQSNRKNDCQSR
jgi:hypothetical protein